MISGRAEGDVHEEALFVRLAVLQACGRRTTRTSRLSRHNQETHG